MNCQPGEIEKFELGVIKLKSRASNCGLYAFWMFAAAISFLLPLHSVPVGNPSLPSLIQEGFFISDASWSNPQCGISLDYLISKRLRPCRSSQKLSLHKAFLTGVSQIGTAAWNIRERFNFQVEIGSGQFNWRWKQIGRNVEGIANGGVIWSGDAKLIILEVKDTTFAADAHAGGWDWMDGPAASNGIALSGKSRSHLRYWQVAASLTQRISLFSPYFGFAINRTRFKVSKLSTGTGWMHARHVVGPFGGCSLCNGNNFLLNLEWRGWFEEGISVSAQVRF